MLTSLALIFLLGYLLGSLFRKLNLPSLLGMILAGIILSPFTLNLLDDSLLTISADLRQFALVIILTRAGLSLNISDLKKVGRPAVLMCFLPACLEIIGVIIFAPMLLDLSILESALLGSVIAAVSPAVIVPRMIHLIEEGYGTNQSIPQLILAGASVDDVFVIVLFTAFTSLVSGGSVSSINFIQIPTSILFGIILGGLTGIFMCQLFKKISIRDSAKIILLLSISFLLIELEHQLKGKLPISGLLAIMTMGIFIYQKNINLAKRISIKYNQLWVAAEILLFVLVGATVDLKYAISAGFLSIALVLCALAFRMFGVFLCLLKTNLNKKEKMFCMFAYTPKATVQAAIGAIPLTLLLPCGQTILTVAVLSILITAPFGAICIDNFYKKLLQKNI